MLIPDWDHPSAVIELAEIYKLLNIHKAQNKSNPAPENKDSENGEKLKYTKILKLECTRTHTLLETKDYFFVVPLAKKNGQILVYRAESTSVEFNS